MPELDYPSVEGCDNPNCNNQEANNTYTDEQGNSLEVCDKCYWELVSGNESKSAIDRGGSVFPGEMTGINSQEEPVPNFSDEDEVEFGEE